MQPRLLPRALSLHLSAGGGRAPQPRQAPASGQEAASPAPNKLRGQTVPTRDKAGLVFNMNGGSRNREKPAMVWGRVSTHRRYTEPRRLGSGPTRPLPGHASVSPSAKSHWPHRVAPGIKQDRQCQGLPTVPGGGPCYCRSHQGGLGPATYQLCDVILSLLPVTVGQPTTVPPTPPLR